MEKIKENLGLSTKQFATLLVSLVLTNVNFYASIEVLKANDNALEKRIDKVERKLFG